METKERHVSPAIAEFATQEMARLKEENRKLREALSALTGLAKMRGGHLHEYKAAVVEADALLAEKRA